MIVSWNWLKDYVTLKMPHEEIAHRLAMSGLNHESTEQVGDDLAIDLEVTSNRADCLGHVGVAREVAVLYQQPLVVPDPTPIEGSVPVESLVQVLVECPELCPRYTARVIRGVKIGPSPKWLSDRLATIGIASVNNVVDVTNYVMMECGQPLHAFDLAKLRGQRVIVREAAKDEAFEAIDHRTYTLQPGMCVIADQASPVAVGGVMGGAHSEVSEDTVDVLLEAADFAPLSVRTTARALRLHSPSSYRFERGVDPDGIDRASRRACELLLDLAGGELAQGLIDVRSCPAVSREPVRLRFAQVERLLGIAVPQQEVRAILEALGGEIQQLDDEQISILPPSWRRDLEREVDLIEEIARIYGYDKIPEDVGVPMAPSYRSDLDRVLNNVRDVLTANGFWEAMTPSLVEAEWSDVFRPWGTATALRVSTSTLRGADRLRMSLIPSLLRAKQNNEALGNPESELFETAKVYLPRSGGLPEERWMIGVVSSGDYYHVKGVIEQMVDRLADDTHLAIQPQSMDLMEAGKSVFVLRDNRPIAVLGTLDDKARDMFNLRESVTLAEICLDELVRQAVLVPEYVPVSPFPPIRYDLNMIVEEQVRWDELAKTVRESGGKVLEKVEYLETYRNAKKDGAGKKRLLFSIQFRAADRTLTGEEADQARCAVIDACCKAHAAVILDRA